MKANVRSFVAGAAVASAGLVIALLLAPKAHHACRTGCSQLCAHGCGGSSDEATEELQHA